MAICKHIASKNGFGAALEYLTMQHNQNGRLLLDGEGLPIPRDQYLIDGIDCTPETFAPLCLQDRIAFGKSADCKAVDTHQYIISFAPSDIAKGLTTEKAHTFAKSFAETNFPGHRVLICTHPDGDHKSGNIHVHIVISSLRFRDRTPDINIMRRDADGNVVPGEYQAGYAHRDTPFLRKHLLSQLNSYCASQGYTLCPEKAKVRISQTEYYLKCKGLDTRNDQLRRAIEDAAATTDSWDTFVEKLRTGYTQIIPVVRPIPYRDRQKLWTTYKELTGCFWTWDKQLRSSLQQQLKDAFQELKNCKNRSQKAVIRETITQLKQDQAKERLFRQTWQVYAKAASLALKSQNQEDAMLCLEQLQELARQQEGYWQEGWNSQSNSFSLVDGSTKSRVTWKQITETDRNMALKILNSVQEEAQMRRMISGETQEVPMPVEVKLSRGEISFRHPDTERWVRGKRLGDAFTLASLGVSPPVTHSSQQHTYAYAHSR